MTAAMKNWEVFERDPTRHSLENDGVSKLDSAADLRYELATFVCEGEYENGLFRIFDTYLSKLSLPTQPAVWVSGFYGSGKSHLVKMLEAFWRNDPLPDGMRPRDLAKLPPEITEQLLELSNQAKRAGGLWAASGMLTESRDLSVRMHLLGIVYKAAGLSSDYGRARFRLWVRQRGWEDEIIQRLVAKGLDPETEFDQYLVSPELADAVWELSGAKSIDAESAQLNWAAQFNRADISIDEMEAALKEVLRLQSDDGKQLPLTLIVLDEVQQYIGDNGARAQAVQEAVERIQTAFESKVLIVATGQAALSATSNLQKLMGRFTVNVMLSDRDVEQVVREVVLAKRSDRMPEVRATINSVEGEIDRQLQTTKIGPRSEDKAILAEDYPLLPTRGRFWAALLHKLDPTGTAAQLRSQLRVVHGATVHVANQTLGHVIPADFIYDQLSDRLQQSSMLPRDIASLITDQLDGTADGTLRARLVQLIFLIEQLPKEDELNFTGMKATPETLADLLVEDLNQGSDDLRRRVPELLRGLEDDGKLMRTSDGSYAIQTGESLKWQQRFQQERLSLEANPGPLGERRTQTIQDLVREQAKTLRKTQGQSHTPRTLSFRFGNEAPDPTTADTSVIAWVRDGWDSSESLVRSDARAAGDESSVISIFVPLRNPQDLHAALANYEAAKRTLEIRGGSQDEPEGRRAADSIRNRMLENERRYQFLLNDAVTDAAVYLGGGAEVDGATLAEKLQTAFDSSLKRLFPRFGEGDHADWNKVFTRASQGNADPLKEIGHHGNDADHPVIRDIRKQIPGGPGISWRNLRKMFESAPYGWPQEAIDGAVAVLVNAGAVNAVRTGHEIRGKDLTRQQASSTQLIGEEVFPTKLELLAARKPFFKLDGKNVEDDEEVRTNARDLVARLVALARQAGGEPPLPLVQIPAYLTEMQNETGNQLIKSLASHATQLESDIKTWQARTADIERRLPAWQTVEKLAVYAESLGGETEIAAKLQAIRDNRQLLANPDPVPPVARALNDLLRTAARGKIACYNERLTAGLAGLKASDEWVRLTAAQQEAILSRPDLRAAPLPALSSDRDLLNALQHRSLPEWDDALDALPTRLDHAHLEAIRMLQPTVQEVALERPLLEKPIDVDRWLKKTREAILLHINQGHPVRIK